MSDFELRSMRNVVEIVRKSMDYFRQFSRPQFPTFVPPTPEAVVAPDEAVLSSPLLSPTSIVSFVKIIMRSSETRYSGFLQRSQLPLLQVQQLCR
jgi:hypothetical protein